MGGYRDLTGLKFERLTVIERVADHVEPSGRRVAMWKCVCDCGSVVTVNGKHLKKGDTKSCGCLQREHPNGTTHGLRKTPLYSVWAGMKSRCACKNETSVSFKNYYSRGIKVCKEWQDDFKAFYDWAMANGYRKGLTLDRINNDGNYEPNNCRWTTRKEQQNNRRVNRLITYKGRTQTLTQWAEEYGISANVLSGRLLKMGWDFEKAITTKKRW